MSSNDSVLSDCLSTVLLGGGILKRCAKAVSEKIQDYSVKDANGLQHHKSY